jgi:hypothetical protein
MTISQNALYSRLFIEYGKPEETQEYLDNETVDQEVGGSNPPSCTKQSIEFHIEFLCFFFGLDIWLHGAAPGQHAISFHLRSSS